MDESGRLLYHQCMKKFRRAVFCFLILRFDRRLHEWILLLRTARKSAGKIALTADARVRAADWALELFGKNVDFDTVVRELAGDAFFDRNMKDIAKLQRETGKSVLALWDTDPIFAKYPRLRTLARNEAFEKWWKSNKQKQK